MDYGAFVPGPRGQRQPLASGALDGLTFAVKDLIDVAGTKTGAGNPDWTKHQKIAGKSAITVTRLQQNGATLIGKTITDELAFSLEGENVHYGTPLNPRRPDRLPGGSSSGSAVAVAAGLADIALGTDTGGSVRVPASFCGVYGFRPTHGRIPLDGVVQFAPSMDTVGLFARTAGNLARGAYCLLASQPTAPRDFRLLWATDAFAIADGESALALRKAAAAFGDLIEVSVFDGRPDDFLQAYRTIQGWEIATTLGDFIKRAAPRFGETIAPRFASVFDVTSADAMFWSSWRHQLKERIHALLPTGHLLLLPSTPGIAPLRFLRGAPAAHFYQRALTLCSLASLAGLPVINLPAAEDEKGCPLGLSVIAGPGEDEALLEFAYASRHHIEKRLEPRRIGN